MYIIPNRVVNNYSSTESLNALLKRIDTTLERIAKRQYDSIRLGLKQKIDLDKYDDLTTYKYILLNKLLGCNCLHDQFLVYIVSRIKKLTN